MDRKSAIAILDKFTLAARQAHPNGSGYAYTSGYFQSLLVELMERLQPSECMAVLADFEKQTRRLEKEAVVNGLTAK